MLQLFMATGPHAYASCSWPRNNLYAISHANHLDVQPFLLFLISKDKCVVLQMIAREFFCKFAACISMREALEGSEGVSALSAKPRLLQDFLLFSSSQSNSTGCYLLSPSWWSDSARSCASDESARLAACHDLTILPPGLQRLKSLWSRSPLSSLKLLDRLVIR